MWTNSWRFPNSSRRFTRSWVPKFNAFASNLMLFWWRVKTPATCIDATKFRVFTTSAIPESKARLWLQSVTHCSGGKNSLCSVNASNSFDNEFSNIAVWAAPQWKLWGVRIHENVTSSRFMAVHFAVKNKSQRFDCLPIDTSQNMLSRSTNRWRNERKSNGTQWHRRKAARNSNQRMENELIGRQQFSDLPLHNIPSFDFQINSAHTARDPNDGIVVCILLHPPWLGWRASSRKGQQIIKAVLWCDNYLFCSTIVEFICFATKGFILEV